MKIILKQDVRDLGRSGDVVEVREGYARNYLLPKKMAVPATPAYMKDLSKRIAAARAREEREREDARGLGERLRGARLTVHHRAAEGSTRLHGSVTAADIAEAIREALEVDMDRRLIDLRQPIRSLGEYSVTIRLMRGIIVPVTVSVVDPTRAPEETPTPAAEAKAAPAMTAAPETTAAAEGAAGEGAPAGDEPDAGEEPVAEQEAAADEDLGEPETGAEVGAAAEEEAERDA